MSHLLTHTEHEGKCPPELWMGDFEVYKASLSKYIRAAGLGCDMHYNRRVSGGYGGVSWPLQCVFEVRPQVQDAMLHRFPPSPLSSTARVIIVDMLTIRLFMST